MRLDTHYFVASREEAQRALPRMVPARREVVQARIREPFSGGVVRESCPLARYVPATPAARRPGQRKPFWKRLLGLFFGSPEPGIRHLPHLSLKDVEPFKLGELEQILCGTEWEDAVERLSRPVLIYPEENRRTRLSQLPSELVSALAAASDEQMADVAQRWSVTDEVALDKWTLEGTMEVVGGLRSLARLAIKQGKDVYLRW